MTDDTKQPTAATQADPWSSLRPLTAARIGLKRAGASLATAPLLEFRLAHAQARDAVNAVFDPDKLAAVLADIGLPVLTGQSIAVDKRTYLMRPDLGRQLGSETVAMLRAQKNVSAPHDVVFVLIDGLSARAVEAHAAPLLAEALPKLTASKLNFAPLVVLRHGRVAIGDRVAELLHAECVVVLIGERPGLSAPDSMGVYLTWRPNAQTSDADRNCISNIRPDGIGYSDAAGKLTHLLHAIRAHKLSGVRLKDDSDRPRIAGS